MPAQSDYLVIYEEDATDASEPDELVLDVHTLRHAFTKHVEVEANVQVDMEGRNDGIGLMGLIVTALGAALSLLAVAVFMSTYPEDWYDGLNVVGTSLRRLTATLFTIGGLAMVAGTVLTASGRRTIATGRIEEAHIVSKEPHSHTELR